MRTYGTPEPPLVEAFSRNPSAMLEHFYWNLGLIPSGIQVALFGATSGKISPDYAPVTSESDITPVLSVAWLAILAAGAFCLGRNWRPWWDQWLKDRAWGWILLLAAGCVTFGVIISQRPRPSYLFAFAILVRAATGMSLFIIIGNTAWHRWLTAAFPVIAVSLVLFTPSYYTGANAGQPQPRPRPLLTAYRRLAPLDKLFERPGAIVATPGYGVELCSYVGKGNCSGLNYAELRNEVTSSGSTWLKILEKHNVELVYINEEVLAEPIGQRLLQETGASWETLVRIKTSGQDWALMAVPAAR